jgi:hypothetical protein
LRGGAGRATASFRIADTAKICNNVGFAKLDGAFQS